jgi:NDP-sugar pyrophosphorylase family protein
VAAASVIVLCAGLGTRLGALGRAIPKPLLPIGDRPQLFWVLDVLAAQGFASAVVNTHHLPERFRALAPHAVTVRFSHEPELRGTAGAIGFARPQLGAPLIVWNGDILANPPLAELATRVTHGGICLLAKPVEAGKTGTLGVDERGAVVRLRGESFGTETQTADYVGIAALGADALAGAAERGCLIGDMCLPRLRAGGSVDTLRYDGLWHDMGNLPTYLRLNLDWLDETRVTSYVHESASTGASVELSRALVHRRASVTGQGKVERCIVLPGAAARAPLSDCIVVEGGEVVAIRGE